MTQHDCGERPSIKKIIRKVIPALKQDNPAAREAFDTMRLAGKSRALADAELARVFLGCAWEISLGMSNRLEDVLRALRDGKTAEEIFPDRLYEQGDPPEGTSVRTAPL